MNNIIHKMNNSNKTLLFLAKNKYKQYSMNEVSKTLQIPYATFYRTVEKLNDLLTKKIIGPTRLITINKENETIIAHLTIASSEEKEEFLKKQVKIKQLIKEINTKEIVLLFGSYAKETQTKKSDIDLLIINNKGEKTISFSKYELIFNIEINPIYITKKEFKQMMQDKEENVGKQALKNHIILNNPQKFWEETINAI